MSVSTTSPRCSLAGGSSSCLAHLPSFLLNPQAMSLASDQEIMMFPEVTNREADPGGSALNCSVGPAGDPKLPPEPLGHIFGVLSIVRWSILSGSTRAGRASAV